MKGQVYARPQSGDYYGSLKSLNGVNPGSTPKFFDRFFRPHQRVDTIISHLIGAAAYQINNDNEEPIIILLLLSPLVASHREGQLILLPKKK